MTNIVLTIANDEVAPALQKAHDMPSAADVNTSVQKTQDIPITTLEAYGAIGDYDPGTGTGTDCSPAIAAIKADNPFAKVVLKPNSKYKITEGIELYSGMNWEGDFSSEFYPDFSVTGKKMVITPDSEHKNVTFKGVTLVRIGTNAEHGGVVDALEDAYFDVRVISDGVATGGAWGVSPFYPQNRPSKNVNSRLEVIKGGNFGLQYGNVSGGSMEVANLDTQREVLGLEPYALGKNDFTSTATSQITYTAHGMITGDPVIYSNQGSSTITGLTNGGTFFAVVIDANTIQLANTLEQARSGDTITLGSTAGTQRVYKAGLCENIHVKGVTSKNGDLASAGSLTGVVIVTATSGGHHRNIMVDGINSDLNNPTSGTQNIHVLGDKNTKISNCNLIGGTSSIQVTGGFLNDISDSTGNIDPSPSLEVLPSCEISDNRVEGASVSCINIIKGRAIVHDNYVASGESGAVGITVSTAAEASGSFSKNNTADVPNGTAFALRRGVGNVDLNGIYSNNVIIPRGGNSVSQYSVNLTSTSNDVCGFIDMSTDSSNYSGLVHITAKANNAGNTETSSYILNVVKKASGPAGELSLVDALGLITGGGTTHPSFTFTIASNRLIATEIGSTDPDRTWYFWITTVGDLLTVS